VAAAEVAFRIDLAPPPSGNGSTPAVPDTYTLGDARGLLRYKRECASFEQWRRATEKPVMSITDYVSRRHWMALNSPQPGRLTEECAATLPVYRRLVRAARAEYYTELDEPTLALLVADVADRSRTAFEALMRMPLDDFGQLWDRGTSAGQQQNPRRRRRRPGRPSDTNHDRDRRIYEAWNSSSSTSFELD
jgi:hypothetical protein